jgi:hypothetical protein
MTEENTTGDRMRNIIPGAAALAAAALTIAACSSHAPSPGGPPAGTGTPATTIPATPAETPAPAADSWTVPAYPDATAAARAAKCDVEPFHPEPQPWVDSIVNCTPPVIGDYPMTSEIEMSTYRTPADEQTSVDHITAASQEGGDVYVVKGKGWLTVCIDLGNECRYVQATIGGDLTKVSP